MNFEECMKFIGSYSRLGAKVKDLSRAKELMERLGDPQNDLKFIHIAGTNGKGSTLEYIANALTYSGYKTGKLTSPFITHYTDRIRIDDYEIDEKSLGEICEFVAQRAADREYSQFEITMAIAFLWFVREKCDIVVLETGIGGLLDSTNVIPSPVASVITSISFDHTDILGNTLEEITAQKAGIIKEGSAVILSINNKDDIVEIVESTAKTKNAEFIMPKWNNFEYLKMEDDGNPFCYKGEKYKTAMLGFCQPVNAVSAIETCRYIMKKGFTVPEYAIRKSLENTRVKARCQYIGGNPPVIVDGGHNRAGMFALRCVLDNFILRDRKIFAVIGMVNTKDYEYGVNEIAQIAEKVFTVDGFASNAVPADKLAKIASSHTDAKSAALDDAVSEAKQLALDDNGIVVICGSLYLASDYLNMCENGKK